MKKLLTLLLLAILTLSGGAKTIHWITFYDTTDPNVGEVDKDSRKVFYSKFVNVVNAALAEKGYTSDIQDYWDTSTSPVNCKKAVENLRCGADDIVVFYYVGHGARPEGEDPTSHPFPQMAMAQHYDDGLIPLTWVHDELKAKGARLTISVAMCCNSAVPGVTSKTSPRFGTTVNYGNAYVDAQDVENIQRLFLENEGDIIATSASPLESSWAAVSFNGLGDIDDYSACFIDIFNQGINMRGMEWDDFFEAVKINVGELNRMLNRATTQTPVSRVNVHHAATAPKDEPRQAPDADIAPTKKSTTGTRTTELNNELSQYFDYLIDKDLELPLRVAMAEALVQDLGTDAVIKIMGQDVDVVIDKEPVDVFMSRLAASRILLKVVPVDVKVDSDGRFTELRVREYYKK